MTGTCTCCGQPGTIQGRGLIRRCYMRAYRLRALAAFPITARMGRPPTTDGHCRSCGRVAWRIGGDGLCNACYKRKRYWEARRG